VEVLYINLISSANYQDTKFGFVVAECFVELADLKHFLVPAPFLTVLFSLMNLSSVLLVRKTSKNKLFTQELGRRPQAT
jgi:hypothetical protein